MSFELRAGPYLPKERNGSLLTKPTPTETILQENEILPPSVS